MAAAAAAAERFDCYIPFRNPPKAGAGGGAAAALGNYIRSFFADEAPAAPPSGAAHSTAPKRFDELGFQIVRSVDDGLPVRDFPFKSTTEVVYFSTRREICDRFGFHHGERARTTCGPFAGIEVVIVGVRAGHLYAVFGSETTAEPFLRCHCYADLRREHGLVPITSAAGAILTAKLRAHALPPEVPQAVHNFLRYAPDVRLEISLDDGGDGDGDNDAARPTAARKGKGKKGGRRTVSFKAPAGKKRARRDADSDSESDSASENSGDDEPSEVLSVATGGAATQLNTPAPGFPSPALAPPAGARAGADVGPRVAVLTMPPVYALQQRGSIGWAADCSVPVSGRALIHHTPSGNTVYARVNCTIIVPLPVTAAAISNVAADIDDMVEVFDAEAHRINAHVGSKVLTPASALLREDDTDAFLARTMAD